MFALATYYSYIYRYALKSNSNTFGGYTYITHFEQAWPSCALPPVPNWKNDNNNNKKVWQFDNCYKHSLMNI